MKVRPLEFAIDHVGLLENLHRNPANGLLRSKVLIAVGITFTRANSMVQSPGHACVEGLFTGSVLQI